MHVQHFAFRSTSVPNPWMRLPAGRSPRGQLESDGVAEACLKHTDAGAHHTRRGQRRPTALLLGFHRSTRAASRAYLRDTTSATKSTTERARNSSRQLKTVANFKWSLYAFYVVLLASLTLSTERDSAQTRCRAVKTRVSISPFVPRVP